MKNKLATCLVFLSLGACQSTTKKVVYEGTSTEENLNSEVRPVLNTSMLKLKQHVINLEPYIFNKEQFSKKENQAYISKEISDLAAESKNVKHDPVLRAKDPTVRFVANQFTQHLQEADTNFQAGWNEYSRWQLMKVTSYCLECHTRIGEGPVRSSDKSNPPYIKTLPAADQIEFMIAFRQFEPAFKLALAKLKEPAKSNDESFQTDKVARLGLLVAVQFLQDHEKAQQLIQVIDKNKDLPLFLKQSNERWKKSLSSWNPQERLNSLAAMRDLSKARVSEIDSMRLIPSLLQYLLEDLTREELGETLYLTAENYEALNKISAMSLHENYYESCVLKAHNTKWAKSCYQKYYDSIEMGYSGSSGVHIPKDIKKHLDDLKKRIE